MVVSGGIMGFSGHNECNPKNEKAGRRGPPRVGGAAPAPAAPLADDAGQARMLIEEARAWFPVSESPEDPGRLDLREIPFWRPAFRTAVPMEGQVCGHLVLYLPREVVREGGKWVALPPQLVPFIGINVARGEETRMVHVRTNRPGCPETAVRPDEDPNKVLRELYGESVRALPLGATV